MKFPTAMATKKKPLMTHLVRELMHGFRLRANSDAMARMAMSGKEVFPVFKYVVNNHVCADTYPNSVYVVCDNKKGAGAALFQFSSEGIRRLFHRYVRELIVQQYDGGKLPFEKITKLAVDRYQYSGKSVEVMLNSWTDIEVFKLGFYNPGFLEKVAKGNVLMTNLRNVEFEFFFEQFAHLLTMAPPFPFPENVIIKCGSPPNDPSVNLAAVPTFPKVKRFSISIAFAALDYKLLRQLPAIIRRFTSVETVRIEMSTRYCWSSRYKSDISKFYGWIGSAKFHVPVEIVYNENVEMDHVENPEATYDHLKSLGFKQDDDSFDFVLEKTCNNVKSIHWIRHTDESGDSDVSMLDESEGSTYYDSEYDGYNYSDDERENYIELPNNSDENEYYSDY